MNGLFHRILFAFASVLFFTMLPVAQASQLPAIKPTYLLCKNRKTVRTIRIVELQGKTGSDASCKTIYNKAGIDRVVGQAHHPQSCLRFMENIRGNLESAHWKCRDVSSATISVGLSTN